MREENSGMSFTVNVTASVTGETAILFAQICDKKKMVKGHVLREILIKYVEENKHILTD